MAEVLTGSDAVLRQRLARLSEADDDYWSFRGNARREHGHGLMQYPAMMVPQMVRALLSEICDVYPGVERVGDPFTGSGTVLTETMLRGLSFFGCDINPLAILLCSVKRGPFHIDALSEHAEEAIARAARDKDVSVDVRFPRRDKWFTRKTRVDLSKVRRAILAEEAPWMRRFLWVALAETVRLTSNSRTSTFKLHKRNKKDMRRRRPDVLGVFSWVVKRNVEHLRALACELDGMTNKGHYRSPAKLVLGDTRLLREDAVPQCQVVITSPPYGDNVTTVPYGQYSYLPLQWIPLSDINPRADADYLKTTHEIDSRSLGGKRHVLPETIADLRRQSATFAGILDQLANEPRDRIRRVAAFVRDLNQCLPVVLRMLAPGGVMVWVLGNRQVGGRAVPLDDILRELLEAEGAAFVTALRRRIPSKRMAIRNSVADTMRSETILVMRKATGNAED